jgi:regulatory protein YycI of two-component signal transduction system YycFG
MDWKKAKNIIIAALLLTNLFLLGLNLYARYEGRQQAAEEQRAIQQLLEERGIRLGAELPAQERMGALQVEYVHLDATRLAKALLEQESLPADASEAEIEQSCRAFLRALAGRDEEFLLQSVSAAGAQTELRFCNAYHGIPIDGSYLICSWADGRVLSLQHNWLRPLEEGSRMETMAAAVALLEFAGGQSRGAALEVEAVELVYWLDDSSMETAELLSDTAMPAWRITWGDGLVAHVSAYNE